MLDQYFNGKWTDIKKSLIYNVDSKFCDLHGNAHMGKKPIHCDSYDYTKKYKHEVVLSEVKNFINTKSMSDMEKFMEHLATEDIYFELEDRVVNNYVIIEDEKSNPKNQDKKEVNVWHVKYIYLLVTNNGNIGNFTIHQKSSNYNVRDFENAYKECARFEYE